MAKAYFGLPLWFWVILFFGIVLRISSVSWNDRLFGDVNLFALTAREYSESGKLYYPMKWDYSTATKWGDLKTPQSQHPPLWSYLAGVLSAGLGIFETYKVLQWMSLISQCLVLWMSFILCKVVAMPATKWAVLFIACSPILIDFAGNGSQYSLGSFFLLASCWQILRSSVPSKFNALCAGVFAGLAFLTHGAFILSISAVVLAIFWLQQGLKGKILHIAASLLGFSLAITPLVIFRLDHFGAPFHNLNFVFIAGVLGKLTIISESDGIFWRASNIWEMTDFVTYLKNCLKIWGKFVMYLSWEWGPVALILGLFSMLFVFKNKDARLWILLLFLASYLLPVLMWPGFRSRFLVPVLPFVFILSGIGYHYLYTQGGLARRGSTVALFTSLGWFAISWLITSNLTGSPARYYTFDLKHKVDYADMMILVDQMKALEKGVVIGAARSLDGGMEGIYWHGFPYVHARPWVSGHGLQWSLIQRLQKDYDAKYFWTDEIMLPKYEAYIDKLKLVATSGKFRLYEFIDRAPL